MSALLGIVVVALVAFASGAIVVLSTLPGDCFGMIDLWDAWRRGEWPTVSRMLDRDRWLKGYRKREQDQGRERCPECGEPTGFAEGIGPFCGNRDCDRLDDLTY